VPVEDVVSGKEDQIEFHSLRGDYLFYKKLKPGKYVIKEIELRGTMKTIGKYTNPVSQYLEISAGQLTIFPFKLVFCTQDKMGDGYSFYYYYYGLKKEDYAKIESVLSKDPNFRSWKPN
jgi:hypothetical protein